MKLFLLITLLINSTLSLAIAREHITYIDFVTMDKESQREVIKMIQNYYTTSENVQNYYIFKNRKLDKKTTFLDLIFNQFIAHADENGFDEPERFTCFYGGWLSQIYINKSSFRKTGDRNPVCANPARLSYSQVADGDKNENIFQDYMNADTNFNEESKNVAIKSGEYYDELQNELKSNPTSFTKISIDEDLEAGKFQIVLNKDGKNVETGETSSESCSVPDDIICNPMVYGNYKGGPFCVPKKSDDAYNTSFLCAKALEKVKEIDGEDEYNKTLDAAVAESVKRPELFSNTLINLYDSCMCKGESYNYTDSNYASSMYNSRTCVAILNSTKNILSAIGRNNSCAAFTENISAVSDMSLFFNRAYQHVNAEVNELNNNYSLAAIDTLYNGDRSKRYQEENRITAIRSSLEDIREQNQGGDDASKKSCPISMDEDAKVANVNLAGNPDVSSMTDTINVSFEVNGETVQLTEGDVVVKLKQVNNTPGGNIEGLNLEGLSYAGGSASITVPMKYSDVYILEFDVTNNGVSGSKTYNVMKLSPVCDANFTATNEGYTVNVSANRSIAGTDGSAVISDGITYNVKLGDADIAYTEGTPIQLPEGASSDQLKMFATIDGIDEPLECNGTSVDSTGLILERDDIASDDLFENFKDTFNLKLTEGQSTSIALVLENATAEQGTLSEAALAEEGSGSFEKKQNGDNVKIIADQYFDKTYQIKFTATKGDKTGELIVTIPKKELTCEIKNKQIDGSSVTVDVEIKAGNKGLSHSIEPTLALKIGDTIFSKIGDANSYLAQSVPDADLEKEIAGTLNIASLGVNDLACSFEKGEVVDPVDPVANLDCSLETEIVGDGKSVQLKASGVFKNGDQDIKLGEDDLPDGYSFQWVRISERAPASEETEEVVEGEAAGTTEENFNSNFVADAAKTSNIQNFTAIISKPDGETLCSKGLQLAAIDGNDKTPTEEEAPVAPTTYGTMPPGQAPQPIPTHRVRGRMYGGNR